MITLPLRVQTPPMYVCVPRKACSSQGSIQDDLYLLLSQGLQAKIENLFILQVRLSKQKQLGLCSMFSCISTREGYVIGMNRFQLLFPYLGACLCSVASLIFVLNSQLLINVPFAMMPSDTLFDCKIRVSGAVCCSSPAQVVSQPSTRLFSSAGDPWCRCFVSRWVNISVAS